MGEGAGVRKGVGAGADVDASAREDGADGADVHVEESGDEYAQGGDCGNEDCK